MATTLRKWMPSEAGDRDPPLIFRLLQLNPELASRTRVLGAGFLGHGILPVRDRELVICRVTGRHGAEHEWGLHASTYSEQAGLTPAQLADTVLGEPPSSELWTGDERRLLEVTDTLAATANLDENDWQWLRGRYSEAQILEFILLTGWYRTVASVCNVLRIEADPLSMSFPHSPR